MLHPTIYNCKKLIRNLHKERGLVLYCDLHGHSKKKNVFMYGCNDPESPEKCRLFPYMLSKLCPHFSFESSRFGVQKSKESTARITLFKEIGIPGIYTMEASFCGCGEGKFAKLHFTMQHLKDIGRELCRTLIPYCEIQVTPQTPLKIVADGKDLEAGALSNKV